MKLYGSELFEFNETPSTHTRQLLSGIEIGAICAVGCLPALLGYLQQKGYERVGYDDGITGRRPDYRNFLGANNWYQDGYACGRGYYDAKHGESKIIIEARGDKGKAYNNGYEIGLVEYTNVQEKLLKKKATLLFAVFKKSPAIPIALIRHIITGEK